MKLNLTMHPAGEDREPIFQYSNETVSFKFKATKKAWTWVILEGEKKTANKVIDAYIQGALNNGGKAPETINIK